MNSRRPKKTVDVVHDYLFEKEVLKLLLKNNICYNITDARNMLRGLKDRGSNLVDFLKSVNVTPPVIDPNVVRDTERMYQEIREYVRIEDAKSVLGIGSDSDGMITPARTSSLTVAKKGVDQDCDHNWEDYEGLFSKDVFCTKCNIKK